jgi:hypothetical protein
MRLAKTIGCIALAALAGGCASTGARSTEWQEITEDEATLVLYGPGLEDAQVTFKRRGSVTRGTEEIGDWQARGSVWPQAWLLVKEAAQSFSFVGGRPCVRSSAIVSRARDKIPELEVCIAEALYDIESILVCYK